METFNKTIKKLTDKDYDELRNAVAGGKNSKPYILLEAARTQNYSDSEMFEKLEVNQSAYYTMKSRLNQKIATYFSRKVDNPISVLKEEVGRIPAMPGGILPYWRGGGVRYSVSVPVVIGFDAVKMARIIQLF